MNCVSDRGVILTGEALERYARKRGLCHICANVQTHIPTQSRIPLIRKKRWEPITTPTEDGDGFLVYKGFCIQPTCYTLHQAQRILGERSDADSSSLSSFRLERIESDLSSQEDWTKESFSSGFKSMPSLNCKPHESSTRKKGGKVMRSESLNHTKTNLLISLSRSGSEDEDIILGDNKGVSFVASDKDALNNNTALGLKLLEFLNDSTATKLDLSEVRITTRSIPSILAALERIRSSMDDSRKKRQPLEELVLNKCNLGRHKRRLNALISGIYKRKLHQVIPSLSLRGNKITDDNADVLVPMISCHTLKVLDLSRNYLENEGLSKIMGAFIFNDSNKKRTTGESSRIQRLNLSRNSIMGFSDTSLQFFQTSRTLQVLSLESNFLKDNAIVALSRSIMLNSQSALRELLLGNNAFGDDGILELTELMQISTTLTIISLGNNNITDNGALMIKEALETCKAPIEEIIGLRENHRISDKSILSSIRNELNIIQQKRFFLAEQDIFEAATLTASPLQPQAQSSSGITSSSREQTMEIFNNDVPDKQQQFIFRTQEKPVVKNSIFEWIERNYSNVSSLVVSESDNESLTTRESATTKESDDDSSRTSSCLLDPSEFGKNIGFGLKDEDWTSGVCQFMGIPKWNTTPTEEGVEVTMSSTPEFLSNDLYLNSEVKKTGNASVVQDFSSIGSLSSTGQSSFSSRSSSNISNSNPQQPRDSRSTSRRRHRSLLDEDIEQAPDEKEDDNTTSTPLLFRTKSALEIEIEQCKGVIAAARYSDKPEIIRKGIESQKRLKFLLPLRSGLPDRKDLENRIEELEKTLQDPKSYDMMLEERLELASAKTLCLSLLREEKQLEAQLKMKSEGEI